MYDGSSKTPRRSYCWRSHTRFYRYFGIRRWLAERLADRVEWLLMTRLLVDRLIDFNGERLRSIFGQRSTELAGEIIGRRREELGGALDALSRQYPDYVA